MNTVPIPEIEHPSLWRLLIHLDSREMTAALLDTASDSSLHLLRFPLADGPTLEGLEELVYDNPLLLSDFRRVDIVLRTRQFFLVPGAAGEAAADNLASIFVPEEGEPAVFVSRFSTSAEELLNLWAYPRADVANFLGRSFNAPVFHHHLDSLVKYFGRNTALGNSGKLYVNIHRAGPAAEARGELDLVAFGRGGRLELANTVPFDGPDDASYYILGAADASGLDVRSDDILLGGDAALRSDLQKSLRRFASYVMPVIFPAAALRFGTQAPEAPFPLILTPLCE